MRFSPSYIVVHSVSLLHKLLLLCLFVAGTAFVFADENNNSPTKQKAPAIPNQVAYKQTIPGTMIPQLFAHTSSDWVPLPLSKVIGISTCIVSGTVVKVMDSTFELNIKQTLKGNAVEHTIQIIKAKPDPFDSPQPAPYRVGQQYLVFLLSASSSGTSLWKLADRGGAAQMPLIESWIYFTDRYLDGLTTGDYSVYGSTLTIQRFDADLFIQAVQHYNDCYRWDKTKSIQYLPQLICSKEEEKKYANTSFIHNYLVTETERIIAAK